MEKDQAKMVKILGKLKIDATPTLGHREVLRLRFFAVVDCLEQAWRRKRLPPLDRK